MVRSAQTSLSRLACAVAERTRASATRHRDRRGSLLIAVLALVIAAQSGAQAKTGHRAVLNNFGALFTLMERVYLTDLYGTPTDIPTFPSPVGVALNSPWSSYGCFTNEVWRARITLEIEARQAGRETVSAFGKSGKPLWPYHCRPIEMISRVEDLNDRRLVVAIPDFIPIDGFLRRMSAFQKDVESIASLAMDVERQIEIYAYWIGKPDESFSYHRESHKSHGFTALSGPSYQIDWRFWNGRKQSFDVAIPLGYVDWVEGLKLSKNGSFYIVEFVTKELNLRF